jgi:hypothetical protein
LHSNKFHHWNTKESFIILWFCRDGTINLQAFLTHFEFFSWSLYIKTNTHVLFSSILYHCWFQNDVLAHVLNFQAHESLEMFLYLKTSTKILWKHSTIFVETTFTTFVYHVVDQAIIGDCQFEFL